MRACAGESANALLQTFGVVFSGCSRRIQVAKATLFLVLAICELEVAGVGWRTVRMGAGDCHVGTAVVRRALSQASSM